MLPCARSGDGASQYVVETLALVAATVLVQPEASSALHSTWSQRPRVCAHTWTLASQQLSWIASARTRGCSRRVSDLISSGSRRTHRDALSRKRSFSLPQKRPMAVISLARYGQVLCDLSCNLVTLEVNGNKAKRGRLSTVCELRCMSVF